MLFFGNRREVHLFHHLDPEALAVLNWMAMESKKGWQKMFEKIDALVAETERTRGVLDSLIIFLKGQPDALKELLTQLGVEEAKAEEARVALATKNDEALAAIQTNPTTTAR